MHMLHRSKALLPQHVTTTCDQVFYFQNGSIILTRPLLNLPTLYSSHSLLWYCITQLMSQCSQSFKPPVLSLGSIPQAMKTGAWEAAYDKNWGLERLQMRLQLGCVSAWTIHVWHWYLIRSCELHLAQGFAVYPNSWVCWIWEHCISYSDGQWVVHRVLLSNKTITTLNISFLQSSGNFLGSFKLCTSAMYLLQSRPMLYTLTTMCTQLFCLSSQVYQPTGEQS